ALNWSAAASTHRNNAQNLPLPEATRIADALVREGLLAVESPSDAPFRSVAIDMHAVLTSGGYDAPHRVSLRLHHITRFLRACLWAKRAVRSQRLYTIACELSEAKAQARNAGDVQRAIELVAVFRRLRPYRFAARDQCLFHALALVKFLAHYDTFPTWVIAVRSRPWGAHSWVQMGDLVLDANPEEISGFTPILAI
ncbi:MAG: lasso peptide biosynthesis B2 protein, partial [Steroidobacteraceae bacterium]